MAKTGYRFNPETLSYDRIQVSVKKKLWSLGVKFFSSLSLALVIFLIVSAIVDSPKEKALKREKEEIGGENLYKKRRERKQEKNKEKRETANKTKKERRKQKQTNKQQNKHNKTKNKKQQKKKTKKQNIYKIILNHNKSVKSNLTNICITKKPAEYIHLYLTGLFYLIPPGAFPALPGIKKLPQLDSNQRHCG